MKATISGQAGLVLLDEQPRGGLYSIDDLDSPALIGPDEAQTLFRGAADVMSVDVKNRETALSLLTIAWKRDRLLQMLLILLRRDAETRIRRMAAEVAADFLDCAEARGFALNRLYSHRLTEDADVFGAIGIARSKGRSELPALLTVLQNDQTAIAEVASVWEEIAAGMQDRARAASLRRALEDADVFYRLASAADRRAVDKAVKETLRDRGLSRFGEASAVVRQIGSARKTMSPVPIAPPVTKPSNVEQLFLQQRETIDRIAAYICRRNHLHEDEASDFASEVSLRLIEDDYAIIRKFEGRSSFTTYLTTVIHRLFYQYRVERWGKWRPSAEARRLGDKAITLERLVTRDGYTFAEASQILTMRAGSLYSQPELERIWYRLPPRHPRPVLVSEGPAAEVTVEPEAEERMESEERARMARGVVTVIDRVLGAADPEDVLILRKRFWSGSKIPEIAQSLHLNPKRVYKRIDKLLGRLRKELEDAGFDREIIDDLLLRGDQEIQVTAGKPKPT